MFDSKTVNGTFIGYAKGRADRFWIESGHGSSRSVVTSRDAVLFEHSTRPIEMDMSLDLSLPLEDADSGAAQVTEDIHTWQEPRAEKRAIWRNTRVRKKSARP